MYVKVIAVLRDQSDCSLCRVADSSGSILALLKKGRVNSFKDGVVVRLIRVKATRDSNRIFLLCTSEDSLVLPHSFSFLEVSTRDLSV